MQSNFEPGSPGFDPHLLIQRLIETLSCSECDSLYGEHDVFVVEQEASTWTLAAFCPVCGAESLVRAYVDQDDSPRPEELHAPDQIEFEEWRQFLARFSGDMRDLLDY